MADDTERLQQEARDALAAMQDGTREAKGTHELLEGVHLLSGAWYADDPEPAWAWMREHAPAYYDPNADVWGLTRYEDVKHASRTPEVFSNHENIRPKTGHVPMMISMDDPEHNQRRRLVNTGFTRRRVRDQEDRLRAIADQLVDRMLAQDGACDFVWTVAAWMPLIAIGDMLGFAPEDRERLLRWSDLLLRGTEGDLEALEEATAAFGEFWAYQGGVIADRHGAPARRPHLGAHAGRGRRRVPRPGEPHLGVAAHPHRRRRDHATRAVRCPAGAARAPRPAPGAARGPLPDAHCRRGVRPLGHPDPVDVADGARGRRDRGPDHPGR